MKNKKFISFISVFILFLFLSSCADGSEPGITVSLQADKKTAGPGETVCITVNISRTENFASADISVNIPENTVLEDCGYTGPDELICMDKNGDGKYTAALVSVRTEDIEGELFKLTYKISSSAAPGDKLEFAAALSSFDVGTDDSGDYTESALHSVKLLPAAVDIK